METLIAALHQLYNPSQRLRQSSTAIKFDVEHLYTRAGIASYISQDMLRTAIPLAGYDARTSLVNGLPYVDYYVKPRFPMTWLWNNVTTRPRGAKRAEWLAYEMAVRWANERRASPTAPPTAEPVTAEGSPP